MDTKILNNRCIWKKSILLCKCWSFQQSHYNWTNCKINDHYPVKSLFHQCISKFSPHQNLITDIGTDDPNSGIAKCCTLFNFRHSPKASHGPWQMDLMKFKIIILEPTCECFHMIHLKSSLFKYISLLMPTKRNHRHIFIFHHMIQFPMRNHVFYWIFD